MIENPTIPLAPVYYRPPEVDRPKDRKRKVKSPSSPSEQEPEPEEAALNDEPRPLDDPLPLEAPKVPTPEAEDEVPDVTEDVITMPRLLSKKEPVAGPKPPTGLREQKDEKDPEAFDAVGRGTTEAILVGRRLRQTSTAHIFCHKLKRRAGERLRNADVHHAAKRMQAHATGQILRQRMKLTAYAACRVQAWFRDDQIRRGMTELVSEEILHPLDEGYFRVLSKPIELKLELEPAGPRAQAQAAQQQALSKEEAIRAKVERERAKVRVLLLRPFVHLSHNAV